MLSLPYIVSSCPQYSSSFLIESVTMSATVYGSEGIAKAYVNLSGEGLSNLNGARKASIDDLVTATLEQAGFPTQETNKEGE